jgi:DNA-binding NarL/FixJ family response regulator
MRDLRIVLADDNVLIREGLAAIVGSLDGIDLVAQAESVDELFVEVAEVGPDVVLTDIRMPPTHTDEGIVAALRLRRERPEIGVVVLSQFSQPAYVLSLFEQGSDGLAYLLKERVSPSELERAIRTVADGGSVIDPRVVEVLVNARAAQPSAIDRLTPRERDVLGLIAEGLNNAAIAEHLVLSPRAISKHINSIFSKLGLAEDDDAHRRVTAVLMWLGE